MRRALATLAALALLFAGLALGCGKYGPPVRVESKPELPKVEVADPAAAAVPNGEPDDDEEGSDPKEARP